MQKTAPRFAKCEPGLATDKLERYAEGWLLDGDIRQHSQRTQDSRRDIVQKLLWFLREKNCATCGTLELRQFLAYCSRGHEDPNGRWGNPHMRKPVRPRTVHTYHGHLRTLFRWFVAEGVVESSPMEAIAPPIARPDQIQPFTELHLAALLTQSKRSHHPRRDEAIILFLLDTAMRASELCELRLCDVDFTGKRCTVLGKGNKHRSVFFGKVTARALWQYAKEEPREPSDPLFLSDRGTTCGEPLTRSGLLQLIHRLGRSAGLEAVRCSPHTFRHTFAVTFLRNGGNVFTLKELLGHTSLTICNRYVALAQADIERQHRMYSPVDGMRRTAGRSSS